MKLQFPLLDSGSTPDTSTKVPQQASREANANQTRHAGGTLWVCQGFDSDVEKVMDEQERRPDLKGRKN